MRSFLSTAILSALVCSAAGAQHTAIGPFGASCGRIDTCAHIHATTMDLFVHGAEPGRPAFLLYGDRLESRSMGGGCTMLFEPLLVFPAVVDSRGRVDWTLPSPIAPDPSWIGRGFYFQHLVGDPAGRAMGGGWTFTNGFMAEYRRR